MKIANPYESPPTVTDVNDPSVKPPDTSPRPARRIAGALLLILALAPLIIAFALVAFLVDEIYEPGDWYEIGMSLLLMNIFLLASVGLAAIGWGLVWGYAKYRKVGTLLLVGALVPAIIYLVGGF